MTAPARRIALAVVSVLLGLACGGLFGEEEEGAATGVAGTDREPPPEPQRQLPPLVPQAGARPEWAGSAVCPVPQLADPDAAYRSAQASDPLEGGVVLCDVRLSATPPKGRAWDAFGGQPDPGAELFLTERSYGRACADTTRQAVLSWPAVSAAAGDKLRLSVLDVDVFKHDDAGIDVNFFEPGGSTALSGAHFSAECRSMSGEAAAARAATGQQATLQALTGLYRAMEPEPLAENWGHPRASEARVRGLLTDLAGILGWAHPDVGGVLALYEQITAEWEATVDAQIGEQHAQLPDAAVIPATSIAPAVTVSVAEASCPAEGACAISLALRSPDTTEPVRVSPGSSYTYAAVLPGGRDLPLRMVEPDPAMPGAEIPPGGALTVRLVEDTEVLILSAGGLGEDGGVRLLRITQRGGGGHLVPIR